MTSKFICLIGNPEDPELVAMDGFDDCVAGVVERSGSEPIICYDKDAVLKTLVSRDGMTDEEALEFFNVNQLGAWVGDRTPCFLDSESKGYEARTRAALENALDLLKQYEGTISMTDMLTTVSSTETPMSGYQLKCEIEDLLTKITE